MEFRKAERRKAKLRLAITGTSGSGKTYGALLIAQGLGGKIAMIDTENGSGDLYANKFDYDVCTIQAPYTIDKYTTCIHDAEKLGYDIIIIDSLSHEWSGAGGILEQIDRITESSRSGNSYFAWGKVTPEHNKFIEVMLNSQCHIIATIRSKTDYVIVENDKGKKEPRKVGLAPVQRDGMEYEFSVVFDLGINHFATVSKDRTSLFDGQIFKLSQECGQTLKAWLETGIDVDERKTQCQELWTRYLAVFNNNRQQALNAMREVTGKTNFNSCLPEDIQALYDYIQRKEARHQDDQHDKQHEEGCKLTFYEDDIQALLHEDAGDRI